MPENSHQITLQTYQELTKIEWFLGDERMDGIMTDYNEELFYTAKTKKKTVIQALNGDW